MVILVMNRFVILLMGDDFLSIINNLKELLSNVKIKIIVYVRVMLIFRLVGYSSFVVIEFWLGRIFVFEE